MTTEQLLLTAADHKNFVERCRWQAARQPRGTAFVYLLDGEDQQQAVTYAELDRRARGVGVWLQREGLSGERILLLYPPGLDFIVALFGCWYAGAVAVPAYPPRRNRNVARLHAISVDAGATAALSVDDVVQRAGRFLDDAPGLTSLRWLATDRMDLRVATSWERPPIDGDSLALLQYTSGSTGVPKGVMLTHANLIHNCNLITHAFGAWESDIGMSWLPAYHDMGLVGGILNPAFIGRTSILMSPMAFLQKPFRWLRAISKFGVTISGGPNFAYDVCTKKITTEEMLQLNLSTWTLAFNGAEPVRASTLTKFAEKFAACGFRAEAFYPCYGLAESTLMITGGRRGDLPVQNHFDADDLDRRCARLVGPGHPQARPLVACGEVLPGEAPRIVDTDCATRLAEGRVGEIWVSSNSIGRGYLNRPEETRQSFEATLPDEPGVRFLRTGDLGFSHEGQLYITGRLKDLIIIRGMNRYPQDIELTVEQSDERLRTGAAAAFSVEMFEREQLIVVCEVERVIRTDWNQVINSVRRSVAAAHDLPPDAVVLIRAGSIPKTSSGKIQRHACRSGFQEGTLMSIAHWYAWECGEEQHANSFEAAPVTEQRTLEAGSRGMDLSRPRSLHACRCSTSAAADNELESLELVYAIVQEVAGTLAGELTPDTNLIEMGLDSLQRLEVANRLEQYFGRAFPEDLLREIETCGEIGNAIDGSLRLPVGHTANGNGRSQSIPVEYYRFDKLPEYTRLRRTMKALQSDGIENPYFRVHDEVTRDTTVIGGRQLLNFSSYNYLGMSGDPAVNFAAEQAIERFGTSVSASRLVSGERPVHQELEQEIAQFLGVPAALVFVGGHATNQTTIGHLFGPGDLILHDALAHNSIVQGAVLSGAQRRTFPHNDWRALETTLTQLRPSYRRVLTVIEGVYSMDGDIPKLPQFVQLKQRHKCLLMVDEAHSIGTLGPTGRGIAEHWQVEPHDVDLWMGTLSKSFGSCGGYIAGCQELIEYLRYTAPGFVYSVGLPPPSAAAALAALRTLVREPERVARCQARSQLFLRLARQAGLDTGASENSPVIPIILGNSRRALQLSRRLYEQGINAQPILYPAVEESASRLRFFITSEHSETQIRQTVAAVAAELAGVDAGWRVDQAMPHAGKHARI